MPENIDCITHILLTEFSTLDVDKFIMRSPTARFRYYIMWIKCEPITSIMLNRKLDTEYQRITYICI